MAHHEAEAILAGSADHLARALKLLDGAGLKRIACARISDALEDLRQEIHTLRMANEAPSLIIPNDLPHALG